MARPLHALPTVAILSPVLTAFLALSAASPSEAATVRGQLRYLDRGGLVAIQRATVDIRFKGTGFFDVWRSVGTATTDRFGNFTHTDSIGSGTYSVAVFATNDAAVVWPVDVHFESFRVPVGETVTTMQSPTSPSSVLNFSFDFVTPGVTQFFSVAETLRIGLDYANARRAPGETDLIPPVHVKPTTWSVGTTAYYNSVFNAIMISAATLNNDWLLLHEYGHHLEHSIGALPLTPPGYQWGCVTSNSPEQTWIESFASYFASAVGRMRPPDAAIPDGPQVGAFHETPASCGGAGASVGPMVEGALWDLLDPVGHPAQGVEAHDRVADEDVTIFQIFDRELDNGTAPTIFTFRSAWIARGKDAAALDCILSAHNILPPTPGCRQSTAVKLAGDFDGDGFTDIALTGARGWGSIPVAFSNGNGTFRVTNNGVADFPTWAANPRAAKLVGDFNGDGRADIALAGGVGWGSIPVAFSDGTGGFQIFNNASAEFAALAAHPEAQKLTGDFNNDGRTDIALIGPVGWQSIPIAFSIGNGEFLVTNEPVIITNFMARASHLRATRLVGHFNNDRRSDILIAGIPGLAALPIALSSGNGTFAAKFIQSSDFAAWSSAPGSTELTGDFNGDGITDVALTSTPGWSSVPMALSNGAGGWSISNEFIGDYAAWAATPRVTPLVGDFDGGGYADIALTGASGWNTVPVASSTAWDFLVDNAWVGDFGGWSATPGAVPLAGDFNGDGRTDIALTGVAGWGSVPVAFSNGFSLYYIGQRPPGYTPGLTFTVTNFTIAEFATWASVP